MLKNYITPMMWINLIELEQGIANGSATATFNGPNSNVPNVDNWDINANDENDNPFQTHIDNW